MLNGRLTAYSGMTTKIRAMKKRLISPEQYEEITNITTVPDLINYLQMYYQTLMRIRHTVVR